VRQFEFDHFLQEKKSLVFRREFALVQRLDKTRLDFGHEPLQFVIKPGPLDLGEELRVSQEFFEGRSEFYGFPVLTTHLDQILQHLSGRDLTGHE